MLHFPCYPQEPSCEQHGPAGDTDGSAPAASIVTIGETGSAADQPIQIWLLNFFTAQSMGAVEHVIICQQKQKTGLSRRRYLWGGERSIRKGHQAHGDGRLL